MIVDAVDAVDESMAEDYGLLWMFEVVLLSGGIVLLEEREMTTSEMSSALRFDTGI